MSTYTKKDQLNLNFDASQHSPSDCGNNSEKVSNVISFSETKYSIEKKKEEKVFDRIISLSEHLY